MTWMDTFGERASDGAETIARQERRCGLEDEDFEVERFGFYL
jgi:hypothetical protein